MKNPLFIPKSFERVEENSKILYCVLSIQSKNIRVLEYYDKRGLIKMVNVWGICGKLEKREDYFVAFDENIDFKTCQGLKKDIEAKYPTGIKMIFY